jgi:hypothetical protein
MGQQNRESTTQQRQEREGQENRENRSTTERSNSNVNVNISSEERTKIREVVVKERNAPRIEKDKINFTLREGTTVPRTVHVVELPQEIIRIHPAWRGYKYFLVGDEIVVVEPDTLRIVAILPA